jgi:hypothetical protein
MEDFGKAKQDFFKTFLELPNGIPDEKTNRFYLERNDWVSEQNYRVSEQN